MTKNGDIYTITMETAIKTVTFSFKLNEEFIDNKPNGEKTNTVIQADGDSLIQSDVSENGKKSKIVYSFTPQELILTNTIEGWNGKSVRTFAAI
ncbi:fatty acid-binding protein, adipocyte-like [Spodoptera litura]|uniref:Fatty acid-binding protein, adipocyte-like n=1 Tax=Spodoptera litura TaxID=69820 RepID=A0A9J7EMR0_SPOLT|nr:fatty acid-binding protein, adipocyte-like [Spodoptera litura]